jgi:double-stranded uracil-DNA glycosylase
VMEVCSFPPLANPQARILILGSMPGKASLMAQQYYAHPRNAFWPMMGELFGAYPQLDYADRVNLLLDNGAALWDVLKSCRRDGSLDASIHKNSMICNDFAGFLQAHPLIANVYFNGAAAEQSFRRLVLPCINPEYLSFQRLPSTSPAHAALSFQQKLASWRCIKN